MERHGENRRVRRHAGLRGAVLLVLSLILFLCGCSGKEQASVPEEGRYQIWYLDHSATMLEPLSYNAVSGYPEELLPALVSQLMFMVMTMTAGTPRLVLT